MSKLDEILRERNPVSSDKWNDETKQQIKSLMLELIGEDEKQIWDAEFGHCERCEFMPTDNTQNCICVFRNQLKAQQRKAVEEL